MSTHATRPEERVEPRQENAALPEYPRGVDETFPRMADLDTARSIDGEDDGTAKYSTRAYSKVFKNVFSFGYKPKNDTHYRLWNASIAATLLVLTLPLLVVLFVAVILDSGLPAIYRGSRLGKDRKLFYIYKFRTLKPQAQTMTVDQVLPARSAMETRIGKILRETRLDELPQLWNVVKGDMNLFGPRPVREEIAKLYEGKIRHYDTRFSVRPGLVGHTQAFLPHRAPKRLRSYYNYILVKRASCPWKEILFVAMISSVALFKLLLIFAERLFLLLRRRQIRDLRATRRSRPQNVAVFMVDANKKLVHCGPLQNINDEVFAFQSDIELPDRCTIVLQGQTRITRKRRRAVCNASVERVSSPREDDAAGGRRGESHVYLAKYVPASELHSCLMDRYFSNRSFITL